MEEYIKKASVLLDKVLNNTNWRQKNCINLIPSENTPSLFVKFCEISDAAGRYAEHKKALKKEKKLLKDSRALKGNDIFYYQGTDFINFIELEINKEFAEYAGATHVESRPISGQQANEIVFKAMVKNLNRSKDSSSLSECGRMSCVMNNELTYGGHLSAQPFGALFNMVESDNVINFPLCKDNTYKIDAEKMCDLIEEHKPPLIVFGKSMFLHPEPVSQAKRCIESLGLDTLIMYDAAHVMGIIGDHFQDPLKEGANVITGSTHKTFFGPQRGIIAVNNHGKKLDKFFSDISSRAFPGSLSNHHLGTLVGMLMATYEMNAFKDIYQKTVIENAKSFAKSLEEFGIRIEGGKDDGYTSTHQVVINTKEFGDGKELAALLEDNNIITNYQALPDDESFLNPSGIRLGVSEMTRFGMDKQEFHQIAGFIAEIIKNKKVLKDEVANFRNNYLNMRFVFDKKTHSNILRRVMESIIPYENDFDMIFGK